MRNAVSLFATLSYVTASYLSGCDLGKDSELHIARLKWGQGVCTQGATSVSQEQGIAQLYRGLQIILYNITFEEKYED